MKIQTDSQTLRIRIHLDSEIVGDWDSNVINTFARGSAVCVQPLHADLFPIHIIKRKPQSIIPGSTFQFKRLSELEKNHSNSKFPRGMVVKMIVPLIT